MEVQSEINPFFEKYHASKPSLNSKNAMSKFRVRCPPDAETATDSDGDYIVHRQADEEEISFLLEHSVSTSLPQVGQQLWRGAFLLADLLIHIRNDLRGKTVLELGAGVGLTSLVAALYAKEIVTTDLDIGDVLALLRQNVDRNKALIKGEITVFGLNWFDCDWPEKLHNAIERSSIIIAADVVYDNDVTEAFVRTITKILSSSVNKILYIALEKRYVFTMADFDTCAPCFEYLMECLRNAQKSPPWSSWTLTQLNIDFPQRLSYERINQLVLFKICN